jgi:hypothetical protein
MNFFKQKPRTVAIVALGPSNASYVNCTAKKKDRQRFDHVWTVNSAINCFKADAAFIMDDLQGIASRYPEWADWLKTIKTPIVTCKRYPDFPTSIALPIEDVIASVKDDFFTTTVAYMIGYAIHIGVLDLYLYGCDFRYPGSSAREPGEDNVAYLTGIANRSGVRCRIPQESPLLDANLTQVTQEQGKMIAKRPLYGYDYNPGEAKERVQRGTGKGHDPILAEKSPYTAK